MNVVLAYPLPANPWRHQEPAPTTYSGTVATWFAFDATAAITASVPESRNGFIRWYDPITGRWLSNDPIGISGGLNQYVFCGNNPVNFRDPDGRAVLEYVLGKGLIGGIEGALSGGLAGLFGSPTGSLSWKNAGKGAATGFVGGFIAGAGSAVPVIGDIGGAALGGVVSAALYSKWQGDDVCSAKSKRSMLVGGGVGAAGGVIDSFWEVPLAGPLATGAAGAGYYMVENLIQNVKDVGNSIGEQRKRKMEELFGR